MGVSLQITGPGPGNKARLQSGLYDVLCGVALQESDLQHLVKESCLIENQYGHYFDWIIVNDDFQVAADMLKEVARRLETESQWVPYAWKE
jgi:hypothetical protein